MSQLAAPPLAGETPPVIAAIFVNGRRYVVPPHGLRIGRAPDNDVVIADPNVSRQHLVMWTAPTGAFVRDLSSQNGTFVDGRRVGMGSERVLHDSEVRIGTTRFRVELTAASEATPAARFATRPFPRQAAPPVGAPTGGSFAGAAVGLVLVGVIAIAAVIVFAVLPSNKSVAEPTPRPTAAATATAVAVPKVAAAVSTATPAPQPTPAPTSDGRDPGLVRALAASVRIRARISAVEASMGSGTVIKPSGDVLTNAHVVSNERGALLNRGEGIIIAIPPSEGATAEPRYLAKVIAHDPNLDFALLRIVSLADGRPLPATLNLPSVPLGDSETVRIGDGLTIVGYPSLGGDTVTVTRGIYSGPFVGRENQVPYFKTDTEINRGNSGGTAINGKGELIGVPTAGRSDQETSGRLGLIRPINLAKPMIQRAG
jgi:S1-C subfamily serine protease